MNKNKKFILLLLSLVFVAQTFFAKGKITIYTYDSLGWIEKKIIPDFEKEYNCTVKLIKFESTGKMLSRLKLEKRRPKADLVIGVNQTLLETAKKEKLIVSYKSKNFNKIKSPDLVIDKANFATSYDYGALAIIYNPEILKATPNSFEDLTKLDKKIIIQDPRTSTTGMDFFLWTIALYQDNWKDFWKRLKPAILTVTPGWSESFAKFEAQEAPMMVSYCTDGAYSYHYYQSTKYKAFIPQEGGYIQLEGAAVVKKAENAKLAGLFIDYILDDKFQQEIPLNQWMFPVTETKLPPAFEYAIYPEKILKLDTKKIAKNLEKWLLEWEKIMY